jgi:hypothetical protein
MFATFALALATWMAPGDGFEQLRGFSTVVVNHVNDALGTENLPSGIGVTVEPGVFVTMPLDRMQIWDQDVLRLEQGRLTDGTVASECASGCPAAFYDVFQRVWLELAVEAATFNVEIPARVLFAPHHDTPATTILQAAYAAAETRPVQVPYLGILVNSSRGGLRAVPFSLVPPRGLELRPGSAALGLTVRMEGSTLAVGSAESRDNALRKVASVAALAPVLREIKKRYPGKETVIIVPDENATIGEVVRLATVCSAEFPRLVLSAGQPIDIP